MTDKTKVRLLIVLVATPLLLDAISQSWRLRLVVQLAGLSMMLPFVAYCLATARIHWGKRREKRSAAEDSSAKTSWWRILWIATVAAVGISVGWIRLVPFWKEGIEIWTSGSPTQFRGVVLANSTFPGAWCLDQTLKLNSWNEEYRVYCSFKAARVGSTYEFVVMPKSGVILSFTDSQGK